MSSTPTPRADSPPETWSGVAAGVVIFLLSGLLLIVAEMPREIQTSLLAQSISILAGWSLILAPGIGVAVGWIKSFPRWSYPYVPLAILLPAYISSVSTPGLTFFGYPTFGRELWGWRAFLPLLLGSAIAWLVTRSFQPLRFFFGRMSQDWTLGTYALSGTVPLVIFISYDEINRAYSLRDMILLTTLLLVMVLVYLRSRSKRVRELALGAGITTIIGFAAISTSVYWLSLGPENVYIPGMLAWTFILIVFYLSPGIISRWARVVFKPHLET